MTAKFETARTLLVADAVHAWESLTISQRSALRRAHTDGLVRIRVDTHARTQDALRRAGILVSLDSDRGKRDLTDMGAFIRSTGMSHESKRSGR
jgi:hypothetical protein